LLIELKVHQLFCEISENTGLLVAAFCINDLSILRLDALLDLRVSYGAVCTPTQDSAYVVVLLRMIGAVVGNPVLGSSLKLRTKLKFQNPRKY
jgi:hypothetical protein